MLQQTQVETVIPYFERFMEKYPTVESLAVSTVDEVLSLWSGLGYYRRARSLYQAALIIYRDGFPSSSAGWKNLPGVGEYTANAIASQAFNECVSVVDGNVERVLGRYLALTDDLKSPPSRRLISQLATNFLSKSRPGDSNQAVMELGALLCRPQGPSCKPCPLNDGCQAFKKGLTHLIPQPRKRKAREKVKEMVFIVKKEGRILLFNRSSQESTLASLEELPWISWSEDVLLSLRERYGGEWRLGQCLGKISHSVTHRDFRVEVIQAYLEELPTRGEWRWVSQEEIDRGTVTARLRKSLSLID